jgi:hypothetical protein
MNRVGPLLVSVVAFVAVACADETLDPSTYDRTCEQNSDCIASSVQFQVCNCGSGIVAFSDDGLADYQSDFAALDRDCTPFEDAIECVIPLPRTAPSCADGQCVLPAEGASCEPDACRGVDDES